MKITKYKVVCLIMCLSLVFNLSLYSDKQNLKSEVSQLEATISDISSRNANLSSQVGDRTGVMVYVTPSGSKYHRSSCSYIRGSSTAIDLYDAKHQGYDACSRCAPYGEEMSIKWRN